MYKDILSFAILILTPLHVTQSHVVTREGTERVVTTSVGDIQGVLDSDGGYYKFLGIPYGLVNEMNPFGDSTAYPQFSDVFQANNDSVVCPQVQNGEVVGDQDCLNLHVYVPASTTAASNLPVVIWIHGGYFMAGVSSERVYGPKFLVRNDVIFVAINYRTGPYGFMCLGINAVPGNQGLKDQYLAFEWVKNNIEAFGGNPNEITLAGNSAGAHSIDLHLVSNREVIYNKVIMQSGSFLAGTMLNEPDREAAIKIAKHLGLQSDTSRQAVSLLAETDALSVIKAATELAIEFKPCVEHEFNDVNPFISRSWINEPLPKVINIPVLLGFNEYERMDYHINQSPEYYQNLDIFTKRLSHTFDFNNTMIVGDNKFEKMEENVRRFYLGDSTPNEDVMWPIINFDSDFVYNHPMQRSIKKYLTSGAGNIFYYMFAYSGGRNIRLDQNNVPIGKAGHNDEIAYLFEQSRLTGEVSPADQLIIDRITTMWANFAKYGNPTPSSTVLLPLNWTPLTNNTYHYLKIDSELSMERRPFNRRMAFLDLFYKHNEEYQKTYDDPFVAEDSVTGKGMANSKSLFTLLLALLMLAFFRY